jgi:hypothetical protein
VGITYTSVVEAPVGEVYSWHERPGAIRRLTPPWQPIRVAQEAVSLRDGRAVLKFPGGLTWVAQHQGYDPPHGFVDELVSLPLPWRHTHKFSAESDSTTRVTDVVRTPVPARLLGQTFQYRHHQLADDLAVHHRMARFRSGPLTVGITGSNGLIGAALSGLLTTGGHRVVRLVRRSPQGEDERQWQPERPAPDLVDGLDVVIHLAGESIAGRFTPAHKRTIRDSRVGPTNALARAVANAARPPSAFITASAIGFYGPDRGDEELDESGGRGAGFLAQLVDDWEGATAPASEGGVRVVHVRTGIVQSPQGGTLRLLRPLFLAGLGGPMGSGQQWTSWIDLDDLTDIYYRAMLDVDLGGAVNAVAPHPVRNREYTATLARVLHRPAVLPVPSFGPRLLLGAEGDRELAQASQKVLPQRLIEAGHAFRRPDLEACLRHQLGRRRL